MKFFFHSRDHSLEKISKNVEFSLCGHTKMDFFPRFISLCEMGGTQLEQGFFLIFCQFFLFQNFAAQVSQRLWKLSNMAKQNPSWSCVQPSMIATKMQSEVSTDLRLHFGGNHEGSKTRVASTWPITTYKHQFAISIGI